MILAELVRSAETGGQITVRRIDPAARKYDGAGGKSHLGGSFDDEDLRIAFGAGFGVTPDDQRGGGYRFVASYPVP